jgi:hypothetical protein
MINKETAATPANQRIVVPDLRFQGLKENGTESVHTAVGKSSFGRAIDGAVN